ncbi:MAG: GNAT family N-acetyltransferase [Clostridiales bacterium]|nr:GNAT family N-acetyltransferase [Clostridiales bacterium]
MTADTASEPVLTGARVTLRPATATDAGLLSAAIATDETTSPWWGTDPDKVRRWLTEDGSHVFAIVFADTLAGVIMYTEENDPDYRFAAIDIAVLSPYSGRGLGPDALRTLARYLFETRGHHRIQIDPTAKNARAIRAYAKVGFQPVGILRRYEKSPDGEWRDGLLMDLLAEDLTGEFSE